MLKSVQNIYNKKNRRKLSVNDIFTKNHYRNILFLIDIANKYGQKITLHHLKYALVKNHEIDLRNKKIKQNLDNFFSSVVQDEIKEHFTILYKIGEISKSEFKNKITKNSITQLREYGWLNENNKYTTVQNLVNHLAKLKNLDIIKSKKDRKKRYPYYLMTKKGMKEFHKFYLKFQIDKMSDDEINKLLDQYNKITQKNK